MGQARVFGVRLVLFGVLYSVLYKARGRKKLYRIAPNFTNLIVTTLIDIVGIGSSHWISFLLSYPYKECPVRL